MDVPGDGHRYFEGLAVTHVLGGLDETEGQIFRSHLLECGVCRARVGELRAIAHELADVERDERRVRAAKAIETKRRENDDDAGLDEPEQRSRATRVLALVGLLAVIALAAWSFTLRGTVANLQLALDERTEASTVLQFGQSWRVVSRESGVEGEVKVRYDDLVLLLDGLDSERVYSVYILSPEGQTIFREPMRPTNGRLFPLVHLQQFPQAVVVTLPPDGRPAPEPSGNTVFEAHRPGSD